MQILFTYVHRLKSQTEKIFLTFFIFLRHMGQVPASSEILHRESIRLLTPLSISRSYNDFIFKKFLHENKHLTYNGRNLLANKWINAS